MRILFDARLVGDELPGVSRATLGLLEGLAQLDHDSSIAVLHDPRNRERLEQAGVGTDERFALHPVRLSPLGLRRQQRLRGLAARVPHDTWHAPYVVRPLVGTAPAVVTAYDFIRSHAGIRRSARRLLTAAVSLRTAAHVVVPSHATAAAARRQLRLPAQRVSVVPLAASPDFHPREAGEVRARYRLRTPYVMHLATNQPHKNTDALVAAWRLLAERGEDAVGGAHAQLVLAGHRDPTRPAPHEAAGVRCLGPVPERDLAPLLAGASAFAFPSLDEGFGLPALEAMASGTAVLAGARGSLPEVVGDGGLLVEPSVDGIAAGLARMLRDDRLRASLAAAGRARAARFSWRRTAEQTLAIHRSLLAGRSR